MLNTKVHTALVTADGTYSSHGCPLVQKTQCGCGGDWEAGRNRASFLLGNVAGEGICGRRQQDKALAVGNGLLGLHFYCGQKDPLFLQKNCSCPNNKAIKVQREKRKRTEMI